MPHAWIKGLIIGIVAVALCYVTLMCIVVFKPDVDQYFSRREFNSQQWKSWRESEKELRLRWDMIDDLTSQYALVGMQREEVIDLLGTPQSEDERSMMYYLGATYRGIDTGSLTFQLNDSGCVVTYELNDG